MKTIIAVHHLTKIFEDKPGERLLALKDITIEIADGEFFVCLGPSGSGKSTLLRIMSGLERGFSGTVVWGPAVNPSDSSFVFQQFALLPWLTVAQNIELNLLGREPSPRVRREKVAEELKRFGLEQFANVHPRELSGGMRQRVGIARALVNNPKIIFMDEPFSELDSFTAEELRKEFLHIWKETKITIIMVTHLIPEALQLADRIAVLTDRPGQIEKVVHNTLPRPRNKRSSEFFALEDELYRLIRP